MQVTKKLITAIVAIYIRENAEEFEQFKVGMEAKRRMTYDNYAKLEGSNYTRALFEMPEELHARLVNGLNVEQLDWFKSKKGAHWFAKAFPVFCLPRFI